MQLLKYVRYFFLLMYLLPGLSNATDVKSAFWRHGKYGPFTYYDVTCKNNVATTCWQHYRNVETIWHCNNDDRYFYIWMDAPFVQLQISMYDGIAVPFCDAH